MFHHAMFKHAQPKQSAFKPFTLRYLAFIVTASFGCTCMLVAQQPGSPPRSAESTIRLEVVVTPKSGAPIAGLHRQDFTLLDNKVPQPITSFAAMGGDHSAVQATVVIDALNISFIGLGREQAEIVKFLRSNGGHLALPTALVVFSEKGFQGLGGASQDGNALAEALSHYDFSLRTIRRSEGVYGAEDRSRISVNALGQLARLEAPLAGRKLILWISPGWPLLSGPGIELDTKQQNGLFQDVVAYSTQLRQAQITLYGIDPLGVDESIERTFYYQGFDKGISKAGQANIADLSLQVLATQSGGLALSSTGIAQLLEKCEADATAYYELTFRPAAAEQRDEYHHLDLKLADAGLVARTRDGYYAQPAAAPDRVK